MYHFVRCHLNLISYQVIKVQPSSFAQEEVGERDFMFPVVVPVIVLGAGGVAVLGILLVKYLDGLKSIGKILNRYFAKREKKPFESQLDSLFPFFSPGVRPWAGNHPGELTIRQYIYSKKVFFWILGTFSADRMSLPVK